MMFIWHCWYLECIEQIVIGNRKKSLGNGRVMAYDHTTASVIWNTICVVGPLVWILNTAARMHKIHHVRYTGHTRTKISSIMGGSRHRSSLVAERTAG